MNSKNPKISVVIPAYNEEEYLPRCLESLKLQTFNDFEIIVVDNDSTDNTAKIAANYGAKVVKETNQGMTPARERGFMEATAEIIVRTDADAILPINWLSSFYDVFSHHPDTVGICGSHICNGLNKIQGNLLSTYFVLIGYFSRILMGHYQLYGSNFAIRKSAWNKIKTSIHMDDNLVHEDLDLPCHLIEAGNIEFHPEIINVFSLRRFRRNFWSNSSDYLIRYFRTIWLHHPYFRRHHQVRRF